jgi:hypothetical protein
MSFDAVTSPPIGNGAFNGPGDRLAERLAHDGTTGLADGREMGSRMRSSSSIPTASSRVPSACAERLAMQDRFGMATHVRHSTGLSTSWIFDFESAPAPDIETAATTVFSLGDVAIGIALGRLVQGS